MKKYSIIYADPPWSHTSWKNGNRRPELHYPILDTKNISDLRIQDIAYENSWLFLWTTAPHLPEALKVIQAWDFEYKTVAFTWVKKNKIADSWFWGCGSYTRANAELCLLAKKGNIKRVSASVHSVIESKIESHSKKPDEARSRIIKLCGELPRIELFAREKHDGWDVWGNEVECDIDLTT